MSQRSSKSEGRKAFRPSFFDQVGEDLRRNPPGWNRYKNRSVWPLIFGFAAYILWKLIH
jgi:hypothetical protein